MSRRTTELAGQVRKLLTSCELRRFFDKRAAVRKMFGSADLLLNPLCVQCPICAAVVALGHYMDIGKYLIHAIIDSELCGTFGLTWS